MNPRDYALCCKNACGGNFAWDGGITLDGITAKVTKISGDVVIVFPGSPRMDWIDDLDVDPVKDAQLGMCHAVFHRGMPGIFKSLAYYGRIGPVSITGHSLGGARARILAGYFISNKLPVKNLVVFGSPKPGYARLRDIIKNSGINHVSYRNCSDFVTETPSGKGYTHTEDYILLGDTLTTGFGRARDHNIDQYIQGFGDV